MPIERTAIFFLSLLFFLSPVSAEKKKRISPYVIKAKTEKGVYRIGRKKRNIRIRKRNNSGKARFSEESPYIIRSGNILSPFPYYKMEKPEKQKKKKTSLYKIRVKTEENEYILGRGKITKKRSAKKTGKSRTKPKRGR